MALTETGMAIGAVTKILRQNLLLRIPEAHDVTIGRPEPHDDNVADGARLNLFLYEIHFDEYLKNTTLREGTLPPVWLVLKYLLTAFDVNGESDTPEAHDLLGRGIQVLQSPSFLSVSAQSADPLKDNPETLHLTFDDSPTDLLHKLMQGSDEKYRLSISFEIRPVMISTGIPPSFSLLVGVDYTKDKLEEIGIKGINVAVIPFSAPLITSIFPTKFEIGSTVTIYGDNLSQSSLYIMLGHVNLSVSSQSPNKIDFKVDYSVVNGNTISAGNHPLSIVQTLPQGKQRFSNILGVSLLPALSLVATNSFKRIDPTVLNSKIFGNIVISGQLLGTDKDEVFVGLYKEGKTVKVFAESTLHPNPSQTELTVTMKQEDAIPPGTYRVILVVNGIQAKNSPVQRFIVS